LPDDFVSEIYEASPGRIYLSTWRYGPCIYDGTHFVYPIANNLDDEAFHIFFKTKNGQYWISDWKKVVGNVNVKWVDQSPIDRSIASMKARVENEYPFVGSGQLVAADDKGDIWIVVRNQLLRFDGKVWMAVSEFTPPVMTIHRIKATSQGRILLATSDGLFIFADSSKKTLIPDDGTDKSYVYELAEAPDGTIDVGTRGGLFRIAGGEPDLIAATRHFHPAAVTVDQQGAVWFSDVNKGLFRYSNGELKSFKEAQALRGLRVRTLQTLPVKGIRIIGNAPNGWIGVVVKTFEFDGTEFKDVTQPKSIAGVGGHSITAGFQIDEVAPGSAAELAWLTVGDTIVDVNGKPIGSIEELDQALRELKPQKEATVGISRKGKAIKVNIRIPQTP
jgi:uncharacterized phage-associated protein